MVVSGNGVYGESEIYDLSGQNLSCPLVSDYEESNYGSVGTFINNKALVCGGYSPYDQNCNSYNIQVGEIIKQTTFFRSLTLAKLS